MTVECEDEAGEGEDEEREKEDGEGRLGVEIGAERPAH